MILVLCQSSTCQHLSKFKATVIVTFVQMAKQKQYCPECRLRVTSNSIKCANCDSWFHAGAEKCARIDITNWSNSWMCLDCSTKSKVNLTSSPGLSVPRSGFPRTPRTPVERKRILSILSDLSSPTPYHDPPHSQLSVSTEKSNKPQEASSVGPTILLAPPQCQVLEVLPEGPTHVSCQTTECSMDKYVQTDSVTTSPPSQADFTKILTLKEKLTDVLMLIRDFLSFYENDSRSQLTNYSITNKVNNTLDFHHQNSALSPSSMNINEGSRGLSSSTLAILQVT